MFPTLDQFREYLTEQRDIIFTSSLKSYFIFITDYFKDKPFTESELRSLLHLLRTERGLKRSTLNKYIRVVRLIGKYLKIDEFDDFTGYRIHDEDTQPKGDYPQQLIDSPLEQSRGLEII